MQEVQAMAEIDLSSYTRHHCRRVGAENRSPDAPRVPYQQLKLRGSTLTMLFEASIYFLNHCINNNNTQ